MKTLISKINLNEPNDAREICVELTNGRAFRLIPDARETHLRSRDGRPITPAEFQLVRAVFLAFLSYLAGDAPETLSYSETAALDSLVPLCDWRGRGPEGDPGERLAILTDCAAHFVSF